MHKQTFMTSKESTQYDSQAYTAFLGKLKKKEADWNEFLPSAKNQNINGILFKYKQLNSEKVEHTFIANPILYTLKNEYNCGYSYGFAFTDLFNTFIEIAAKFYSKEELSVYAQNVQHDSEELKVIEYTEMKAGDFMAFIKVLQVIGKAFSQTEKTIEKWLSGMTGRDKQEVMIRFGLYTNALLSEQIKNNDFRNTPYHWYAQLKKCESITEISELLSVYNINFEKLISGFEQFYTALNRQKGIRGSTQLNKIDRPIYID